MIASHTPVKFLAVDDREENLLALDGLLRREGLELLKARSGREALELLLAHDVALALLDVQMPEMDGFELAEFMRGTDRTRRVPIIFITAGGIDTQRRFRGYDTGAVDFLFKPIDAHILRSKAEVFFELYRQRQEVAHQRDQLAQANADLECKVQERTARLRETIAELEHFSYTITHDMRAPLRAMQAFGQMLTDEHAAQLDAAGKDLLRRIINASRRMDLLITDALNYSKLVKEEMELGAVDLGTLLRGMIESYPEFQPHRAEIQLNGEFPIVMGNQAGLTQCFSNLLGNAVKFIKPGHVPRVRVRAERTSGPNGGAMVRVWVEDEGIGIAQDQQQRIFEMFQRVDRNHEGTGIGLALVRKVIERMKGRVGVESQPGVGSRFWVELPQAAPKRSRP